MQVLEADFSRKQTWNDFVLENKGEFLQSWEWGDFQAFTGKKIWRFIVLGDSKEILGAALVIRHKMPLGRNYLYCPKGPVIGSGRMSRSLSGEVSEAKESRIKILSSLLDKTKEIGNGERAAFLRVEPTEQIDFFKKTVRSVNFQPKDTLILDLAEDEEKLLAGMKQKTRYNIKLAGKHGVKTRMSDKNTFEEDFEKFWHLTEDTTSRDGFQSHPKNYYKKMLEALNESGKSHNSPSARLFLAEFEGQTLAANIVVFFGKRAVYLHGASSSHHRNLMAPYFLQWEQIKKARDLGFKEYDFWGIDPRGEKDWGGITRFKLGFGGREVNYPQALDIVYQPIIYNMIKVGKKIKKFARR